MEVNDEKCYNEREHGRILIAKLEMSMVEEI